MNHAAPMTSRRLEDIEAVAELRGFLTGAQARELIAEVRALRAEIASLIELHARALARARLVEAQEVAD